MGLTVEQVRKYTYGTDFFLIDHRSDTEFAPITYNISYDGNEFTFTPSEVIKDDTCGYATVKISDKSLLSGVTKIMALATSFAVQYTSKSKSLPDDEKDQRFIFTKEKEKQNTVDLYINYTNNMVFKENSEKYDLLKHFIFPHSYFSKYTNDRDTYQEKELLHIKYTVYDNNASVYPVLVPSFGRALPIDKSPSKYYKDFLNAYNKEEGRYFGNFKKKENGRATIADILSGLQVKEQIDVPTRLVLFGVCNRFGAKNKGDKGICAILYINHKISVDDYISFKERCNEQLEKYLKQFSIDLTIDDIKNMTTEKLKSLYGNDFKKVALLTKVCGYVRDPRILSDGIYDFTYFNNDGEYSEENGLNRWAAIKKYYPELFKGLKAVLDYYLTLKDEYASKFKDEYMSRINQLGNKHMENLLADDSELGDDPTKIIKYIKNYLNDIYTIQISNWDELIDILHMVSQGVLDIFSDIYTEKYKEDVRNYSYEHPRAKNAELLTHYVKVINAIEKLFKYRPFDVSYLPESLKNMLSDYKYEDLRMFLSDYFIMEYLVGCRLFNNDQLLDFKQREVKDKNPTEKDKIFRVYNVNIKDALKTLNVNFFITNTYDITQSREFESGSYRSASSMFSNDNKIYKYPSEVREEFINTILASGPVSFELVWHDNYGSDRIFMAEPINDTNPDILLDRRRSFDYNTTVDDIIKGFELDENTISKFIDYKIILKFDENAINANLNKLKAILDNAEKEINVNI